MLDEILINTEGQVDLRIMWNDPEWMMDAMVGHGFLKEDTRKTIGQKYLANAFNHRKMFVWDPITSV